MKLLYSVILCLFLTNVFADTAVNQDQDDMDNDVDGRIRTSEDLVTSVMTECSSLICVKDKVLNYLDSLLGLSEEAEDSRNFQSENIDKVIYKRVARLVQTQQFKATLPGGAVVTYNPYTGLDLDMPAQPGDDQYTVEARGLLKKKLLLPVLLLLKLKLKALMPIFVAIIGIKSLKALVLSKLAILLVVGFLIYQLCIKGGMMPMPMSMSMTPAEPPSNAYGAPVSPSPPASSYEPSWEPSSGGPYSRIWTSSNSGSLGSSLSSSSDSSPSSSAHNIAYSAYYPLSSMNSGSSSSSGSYSSSGSSTNSPVYRTN